jgi:acetyl-CoA C-acetyltransferase
MREAVIVSTARTPIGKAYRGAFNDTTAPTMAAPVIQEVLKRAKVEPGEIDDLIMGAALQEGTQGYNVARQCAIAAGLPMSVSGQTIDRQCSSGLMSVSMAAKQIIVDGMQTVVASGIESISLVQNDHQNVFRKEDAVALKHAPALYMAMLDTAETVSTKSHAKPKTSIPFRVNSAPPKPNGPGGLMPRSCRPRSPKCSPTRIVARSHTKNSRLIGMSVTDPARRCRGWPHCHQ